MYSAILNRHSSSSLLALQQQLPNNSYPTTALQQQLPNSSSPTATPQQQLPNNSYPTTAPSNSSPTIALQQQFPNNSSPATALQQEHQQQLSNALPVPVSPASSPGYPLASNCQKCVELLLATPGSNLPCIVPWRPTGIELPGVRRAVARDAHALSFCFGSLVRLPDGWLEFLRECIPKSCLVVTPSPPSVFLCV